MSETPRHNVDFPLDGRLLDSVSDEELVELFDRAPRLHEFSTTKIFRIPKPLVLKGGPNVAASQARNMVFAAESLRLPVSKVHRSFTASVPQSYSDESEDGHFIVMDYIAGSTLEEAYSFVEMVLSKLSDRHDQLARRKAAIAYGLSTGRLL
ncbi:hypothetical protein NKR19_g6869 [Coniochaeta hoffmannii]|uniref:Aminoglycoside phosphotransferase domain-containing protein n=1 Tax=Coniochaeta hoffmannii TaxID=91930 RepID=A0AA38RP13_9PEZI|nr:hypothetical protein NKR19_g6869 [Coniochaeta hoffmannii]